MCLVRDMNGERKGRGNGGGGGEREGKWGD